jgi:hypothetical protein
MSVIRSLLGRFRFEKKPIDWQTLVEAISAGSAYLSQGASYSYLRARTLLAGPRLFQDEGFGFAMDICKWEGFAVAGQDILLMIESELRPRLPNASAERKRLLMAIYRDVLASHALPTHRQGKGWSEVIENFDGRLDTVLIAPPEKPDEIAKATAMCLLAHAPIDASVRAADGVMVINNVGFRFIDFQSQLRKQFDFELLAQFLALKAQQLNTQQAPPRNATAQAATQSP